MSTYQFETLRNDIAFWGAATAATVTTAAGDTWFALFWLIFAIAIAWKGRRIENDHPGAENSDG